MSKSDEGGSSGETGKDVTGLPKETPAAQHSMEQFEPDESPLAEYLSEIIRLPGFWNADDTCEELKPVGFCHEGHVQLGGKQPCGTRKCPHHWSQWRKRASAKIVARLAAYRYSQGNKWARGRRMLHVVASPDQEQRWTTKRFWDHRTESSEPVEAVGGRGGAVIPHPYGVSESGNELFAEAVEAGLDPSYGKWRFLRNHADDWEEMQDYIEVHPHFHQLVPAGDLDGDRVEEIEAETGWAVNNVRSLAPFYLDANEALTELSKQDRAEARKADKPELEALREKAEERALESYVEMGRLSMYLLSHGAVQEKTGDLSQRQTVTYWGEVHPNSFDPEEELTREEWEKIQRYAEAAVGGELPEESGMGTPEKECQLEDCEAVVHEIGDLFDYLNPGIEPGPEWFESLDFDQQCEIWGLKIYLKDGPPPGGSGQEIKSVEVDSLPGVSKDGEVPEPKERALPSGGMERSAATTAPNTDNQEEYREWLRGLGRSRIHQNPFYDLEAGSSIPRF